MSCKGLVIHYSNDAASISFSAVAHLFRSDPHRRSPQLILLLPLPRITHSFQSVRLTHPRLAKHIHPEAWYSSPFMPSMLTHRHDQRHRPRPPPGSLHNYQPHHHHHALFNPTNNMGSSNLQPKQTSKQLVPLSVTVVIVTICLIIVSLTVSSRLLSSNLLTSTTTILTSQLKSPASSFSFSHSSSSLSKTSTTTTITPPITAKTTLPLSPPSTSKHAPILLPPIRASRLNQHYDKLLSMLPNITNTPTTKPFILYRAIGNDLPPRHSPGQTYDNVKFILENEPTHHDLDRRWYLNRIINASEALRLISLLDSYKEKYVIDIFNITEYTSSIDYRLFAFRPIQLHDILRSHIFRQYSHANVNERRLITDNFLLDKNQYIIHNNFARNKMIALGMQSKARYILPWDGNCFITKTAWNNITNSILNVKNSTTSTKYFYTPMIRMTNNSQLLNSKFIPKEIEEEPQMIFRNDSIERFNHSLAYGCRPKVNMLIYLKVPGNYSHVDLNMVCIGLAHMINMSKKSPDVPEQHGVRAAGWVARLFSGKLQLERTGAIVRRGFTRTDGVETIASKASLLAAHYQSSYIGKLTTALYDRNKLAENLKLYKQGQTSVEFNALVNKLITVSNTELSNFTTDSSSSLALQQLNQDKMAVPESISREHICKYAIIHTLTGLFTGDIKYILRGKSLLYQLFINPATAVPTGVISDVQSNAYYMCVALDAVKLQLGLGGMSAHEHQEIRQWAIKRLNYYDVSVSNSAREVYFAADSIGTFGELTSACSAMFVADSRRLYRATALARPRLWQQYGVNENEGQAWNDGVQGIVGWVGLAEISRQIGVDTWGFGKKAIHGGSLIIRDVIKKIVPKVLNADYKVIDDVNNNNKSNVQGDGEEIDDTVNDESEEQTTNSSMTPKARTASSLILKNSVVRMVSSETTKKKKKKIKIIKVTPSLHAQKVMAEYVWWMSHSRYHNVRGGFWGDAMPKLDDIVVAKSVYDAPEGVSPPNDHELLIPPFWNLAM